MHDPSSHLWNTSLQSFTQSVNDRIDQILDLINNTRRSAGLKKSIDFGLHTAVYNLQGGPMLDGFNDCIRQIAIKRNFTLYDYDNDVHATRGWIRNDNIEETYLLRDWLHPKEVFTAMAGEKMLSNIYSSYFSYNSIVNPDTPQLYINTPTRPRRIQIVYLVLEGQTKFIRNLT